MLGGHNETCTGLLLPNIINESDCKVQQFGLMIQKTLSNKWFILQHKCLNI